MYVQNKQQFSLQCDCDLTLISDKVSVD